MSAQFDESDFVDHDFQSAQKKNADPVATTTVARPPSREELDERVTEAQHKLAELERVQEELERERTALEEARRRRIEFQKGRDEMLAHLTRGLGLLEETEFKARQEAEQMARTNSGLRDALQKLQSIQEENWTEETWTMELTRALTIIENARMEWNSARLKWTLLNGTDETQGAPAPASAERAVFNPATLDFRELCKMGIAFTWPLVLVCLIIFGYWAWRTGQG